MSLTMFWGEISVKNETLVMRLEEKIDDIHLKFHISVYLLVD